MSKALAERTQNTIRTPEFQICQTKARLNFMVQCEVVDSEINNN